MRVILLAAGAATRLKPLTDETPKCLLQVGARTIVSRTVGLLADRGLRRFTVVDGFCGEKLRAALAGEFPAAWFSFVRNELYASTNNAYSLMLARSASPEPILLLDSDVLFDPAVLDRLLDDSHPNRLGVRNRGEIGAEEIKVTLDAQGRIVTIGKEGEPRLAMGESIGVHAFSADFAASLFVTLERRQLVEKRTNEYYEASFQELCHAGHAIYPVPLDELRSMEVDTAEDLARARAVFG
jgi:choline kinase